MGAAAGSTCDSMGACACARGLCLAWVRPIKPAVFAAYQLVGSLWLWFEVVRGVRADLVCGII